MENTYLENLEALSVNEVLDLLEGGNKDGTWQYNNTCKSTKEHLLAFVRIKANKTSDNLTPFNTYVNVDNLGDYDHLRKYINNALGVYMSAKRDSITFPSDEFTGKYNLYVDIDNDYVYTSNIPVLDKIQVSLIEFEELLKNYRMKENSLQLKLETDEKEDTAKELKYDYTNPQHYKNGSIEVCDMMKRIWGEKSYALFCEMNAFKYRMRAGNKPGQPLEQEFSKVGWYEEERKKCNIEFSSEDFSNGK